MIVMAAHRGVSRTATRLTADYAGQNYTDTAGDDLVRVSGRGPVRPVVTVSAQSLALIQGPFRRHGHFVEDRSK